ncbi:2-dehydropantoate 2-reductase [Alteromonas ponticola]|uniref:2-dehydropantoate 2-reductase n=1 Tax=Alteromonas ponticola TaxID=2720613 RepID=A0ABX1QWX0_9ALTE|nr:2-dehydropantoate 2-reductase [Alteromonas ponticola]
MLHVIFGAGLIGCFVGGVLASNNMKVKFVARDPWCSRLRDTMILSDYAGNLQQVKHADPLLASGQKADVIWLTTKCTGIIPAIRDLELLVHAQTVIICCQNGVGTHQLVQKHFSQNRVLRAMVPFNVVLKSPNQLHRGSEGMLTIEAMPADVAELERDLLAASQPLMQIATTPDINALQWAKLQLNLGNSVNALADIPVKAMLEQRDFRRIIALAMREFLDVINAMDIKLPKVAKIHGRYLPLLLCTPDWLFKRIAKQMLAIDDDVRTSMWWDLQAHKQTEIAYLNGAVVTAGKTCGVACPVNSFLVNEIKKIEEMTAEQGKYEGVNASSLLKKLMQELKKDSAES